MTKKLIIDGITHVQYLKKGKFGWWDLNVCTRKRLLSGKAIEKVAFSPKYFKKVHIVITIKEI